jgi:hypothetical protein
VSLLRTLKKLLFGETWLLPLGLAAALAATVLVRRLLGDEWHDVGGFVLLAGVGGVFLLSVAVSARPR